MQFPKRKKYGRWKLRGLTVTISGTGRPGAVHALRPDHGALLVDLDDAAAEGVGDERVAVGQHARPG